MSMDKYRYPLTQKDQISISQAAPVQNTWYTVARIKNAKLRMVKSGVLVADEEVQIRVTVDGIVFTHDSPPSETAATAYYWSFVGDSLNYAIYPSITYGEINIEGKNILVEIRKKTAAGAGNLEATIRYGAY